MSIRFYPTIVFCRESDWKELEERVRSTTKQWRKKMFLNRGAIYKIACKVCKKFFGSHDTPSNHAITMLIWL